MQTSTNESPLVKFNVNFYNNLMLKSRKEAEEYRYQVTKPKEGAEDLVAKRRAKLEAQGYQIYISPETRKDLKMDEVPELNPMQLADQKAMDDLDALEMAKLVPEERPLIDYTVAELKNMIEATGEKVPSVVRTKPELIEFYNELMKQVSPETVEDEMLEDEIVEA